MVNGRPELLRKSSPIFLYFRTPNRFIMLHGNSLNLVTPIDDTRTTLFTEEGNADTRFFTPTQSTLSGVLSSSQRLEGNAVVPVQQITCVTSSNKDGSKSSWFLVSPLNTCSFSLSCSPNSSVAFSGFLSINRVEKFKVGDKVGVGCLVDSCRTCQNCSEDLENYCPQYTLTYGAKYKDGTITYGGYSDSMVVDEHFVVRIPDGLPLDAAAPLLCAGITVYSPLRYFALDKPGLHVGVVGLGGLGHMAVKFAKAFGAKVTVISTSPHKKEEAIQHLGADSFLISRDHDEMQGANGTLDGIIDTVSAFHPLLPLIGLLKSHGKLVMVGAPEKPLELPVFPLLSGRKIVAGSGIGGMKETQEMMDFAAKNNVKPDIEIIPIDYVNTAMERLLKADVKYRFVIDIGNTLKPSS